MARRAALVAPAPGKERFAQLIDESCGRLGLITAGQVDRRALAVRCGLSETTLVKAISGTGRPSTKTLLALERVTGVPVELWLESLRLLRPGLRADSLTPSERRLLEFARRRGDRWIDRTLAWLEAGEESRDSGREGFPRPGSTA